MNQEIFHLYGMRITVLGDTSKARDLAFQARRLNFRRDNAGVPQLRLNYPDGSFVHVLRQADMDFATIYVPEISEQQKGERERIEILYIPAFEVINRDNEIVGWILARGEGWQGPYEFIPKLEGSKEDLFEWGQWMENYETCPFDDIDEYLKHKLVYTEEVNGTSRTIWDVPPVGTRNRLFVGMQDDFYEDKGSVDSPYCVPHETEIDVVYTSEASFSKEAYGFYHRVFIYNKDREDGSKPPEYPNYFMYDASGSVPLISLGTELFVQNDNATGTVTHKDVFRDYTDSCDEAVGGFPAGVDATDYIWGMFQVSTWNNPFPGSDNGLPITHCVDYIIEEYLDFYGSVCLNSFDYSGSKSHTNIFWSEPCFSSVENENHYGLIYATYDISATITNDYSSEREQGEKFNLVRTRSISNYNLYFVFDGDVFNLNSYYEDELDSLFDGGYDFWIYIRYYHVGTSEWVLGVISQDVVEPPSRFRYFYGKKTSGRTEFQADVLFENPLGGSPVEFPDIKSLDNEPVYLNNKFRLFKEVKTIKEEING